MRAGAALLCHAFLLQLAAYVVRPTSAYRAIELGVDPRMVGLIAASFALLPLVVAVTIGRWNDRGHVRPSLFIGGVLMTGAGLGVHLWSQSLTSLLIWNAVIGLGHLLAIVGQQTLVAQLGRERLDSAFGTYTFVGSLGQAAAPLVLSAVGGSAVLPDTGLLFAIYTVTCACLLGMTGLLPRSRKTDQRLGSGNSLRSALGVPPTTRRTMTGAMLLSMLVLAAVDLIQVYLPALGVERRIPSATVGVLLAVRAAATMASRLGLARLTGRVGRTRLATVSTIVAGVAVGALAVPMPTVVAGLLLAVAGFALGIGQPLSMTIVTTAAPAGTTSTWLALRLTGNRVGQSVIPAVLSAFTGSIGTGGIFVVTGIGLLGTAAAARILIADDP
ncbi:MFS transporter [Streptomyces sp. SID4919]|uniref:MFS transporter n=1 Tax=unclassified Streptomyces TaxID=2593676 RepID=UPI000823CED0|nr:MULTISPECIES: MFS transporter [unclassified Streptomyces]MYY10727.1 MFS transporter [Streptomyces sp. SID4919]SCK62381.1 Predicted arabinose efflux permease, MFS family [Streptomyces sp. AmelKG-E11A]